MKSFKQRLQDHGNLIISLEQDLIKLDVPSQPQNPKTEPPACEISENESTLVLHSASDLTNVAVKEDEEKPGVEMMMMMDLSATPESKEDTKEKTLDATLHSTAAKGAAPMYEIKSEEPLFDEMKGELVKVMTESASQHKLKKEIKMVAEENAVSLLQPYKTRLDIHFLTVLT